MTELNSSIANSMRTFPQKYKHLNIVLRTFQSRIRNWKRAFRKFGKFEERSSKFLEIRKLEVISNEWTPCKLAVMSKQILRFNVRFQCCQWADNCSLGDLKVLLNENNDLPYAHCSILRTKILGPDKVTRADIRQGCDVIWYWMLNGIVVIHHYVTTACH